MLFRSLAFWLYIAGALTDWLDGIVARRANQVSAFGRFMDAVIDKVMVIGMMIALLNGDYFMGYDMPAMLLLLVIPIMVYQRAQGSQVAVHR